MDKCGQLPKGQSWEENIREDGVELNKCQQQVQKGSGAGVGCRMGRGVMDQREIPSLSVRAKMERTGLGETGCKQVFSKEETKGRQGKGSVNK